MDQGQVFALAGKLSRPLVPLLIPTPYPVGPVWVYLLPGEPVTLVDTGPATRLAWKSLKEQLAQHGFWPQQVKQVLVTHGHHDHMGLATRFQRLGAEVFAHPADSQNLALRRHYRPLLSLLRSLGVRPSQRLFMVMGLWVLDTTSRPLQRFTPLAHGQELPSSFGVLRVHHVPGHSPGHVAFEIVGEDVWISGDVLLEGIVPNAVLELDPLCPERPFPSLSVFRKTLQQLRDAPPKALLPAHGPAIFQVAALAQETLSKQERRCQQLLSQLGDEPQPLGSLLRALYPKTSGLALFLAYSDLFGQLLHLEKQGAVLRTTRGKLLLFARTPRQQRANA